MNKVIELDSIYGNGVVVNGKALTKEAVMLAAVAKKHKEVTGKTLIVSDDEIADVRGLLIMQDRVSGDYLIQGSSDEATHDLMRKEIGAVPDEFVEVDCDVCDDEDCLCRHANKDSAPCEVTGGECYKDFIPEDEFDAEEVQPADEYPSDEEIVALHDSFLQMGEFEKTLMNTVLDSIFSQYIPPCAKCGGTLRINGYKVECDCGYSAYVDSETRKLLVTPAANEKPC